MAKVRKDDSDWFLKEWLAHFGKKQADIQRDLGWSKNRASIVVNSQQPYGREDVRVLSEWLGIRSFELLMKPEEALALRRLRETAVEIARSTGTDG